MRVLVTGAGGFLGSWIVECLCRRGDRVRGMYRTLPRRPRPEVEVVSADLRDRAAVSAACVDMDAVLHVAAVAGTGGSWRHYFDTNVLGTRNVLAACTRNGVNRLVYTSSPSVTFAGRDQCGVDETIGYADRWLGHYSHTKAIAEREVLAANGRQGLATCALRPHLVWGPGDRHLLPRLLTSARTGRLLRIGNGENLVDTTFVENAATAHLQALDALQPKSPVAGSAYFLSQGEPIKLWPWIDEVLAIAGLPSVRRAMSPRVAWPLGRLCESVHRLFAMRGEPLLSRYVVAQLSCCHYYDIRRARTDFGYEPRVSFAEGMLLVAPLIADQAALRQ